MYVQFDVCSCVPLPQETEQPEYSLQDDQVGHDCVLQDPILFRCDSPLSKTTKVGCHGLQVCINVKSDNYRRIMVQTRGYIHNWM